MEIVQHWVRPMSWFSLFYPSLSDCDDLWGPRLCLEKLPDQQAGPGGGHHFGEWVSNSYTLTRSDKCTVDTWRQRGGIAVTLTLYHCFNYIHALSMSLSPGFVTGLPILTLHFLSAHTSRYQPAPSRADLRRQRLLHHSDLALQDGDHLRLLGGGHTHLLRNGLHTHPEDHRAGVALVRDYRYADMRMWMHIITLHMIKIQRITLGS